MVYDVVVFIVYVFVVFMLLFGDVIFIGIFVGVGLIIVG